MNVQSLSSSMTCPERVPKQILIRQFFCSKQSATRRHSVEAIQKTQCGFLIFRPNIDARDSLLPWRSGPRW